MIKQVNICSRIPIKKYNPKKGRFEKGVHRNEAPPKYCPKTAIFRYGLFLHNMYYRTLGVVGGVAYVLDESCLPWKGLGLEMTVANIRHSG